MRQLFKYELNYYGGRTLTLPIDFKILALADVLGTPTLWIAHEGDVSCVGGLFDIEIIQRMDYSQAPIDDGQHYIGTVVAPDGPVWHFFYEFK